MLEIKKSLRNILGWRSKRKIVVFESDDWGSIRTRSKADYEIMLRAGLQLDQSNFTRFDALESNRDLENLYEVLSKHKDSTGRHPVFTPMCIVANPDFDRINASGFKEYHYECFIDTCERYPEHNKVRVLYQVGVSERLFVPQLHGREHLNVAKWMRALQSGHKGLILSFKHHSLGASHYKCEKIPEYLAAFHPEKREDIPVYESIIYDAGRIFQDVFLYRPRHFIASNSPEPKSLEKSLKEIGVDFLTRYKIQRYPLGDGKFTIQFNWIGKRNSLGQTYLTRNAGFEPSSLPRYDWIDVCMKDIENAFSWNKPAVISSHRVNYIGFIDWKNAAYGLSQLDGLLSSIIKKWPDVEFMSSIELGDLIKLS